MNIMERKNAWKKYTEEEKAAVFAYGDEYRQFISDCKTERECVTELKKRAIAAGFQDMEAVIAKGITLKAGDRVFADNKGKSFAMYIIGQKPMEEGMNILGAHIDSPRLDLKQNPLYGIAGYALLWRCQEISVGDTSTGYARCHCEKRWFCGNYQHR